MQKLDGAIARCVKARMSRMALCVKWLSPIVLAAGMPAWGADQILIEGNQLLHQKDDVRSAIATGLYAVADLHKSPDASTVLLTAKKTAAGPWQIFELRVIDSQLRQVTNCSTDCLHGAYLPEGKIAFTVRANAGSYLAVAAPDGSALERITFAPGEFELEGILPDGRILFFHDRLLYAVRPDGAGFESIRCNHKQQGFLRRTDCVRVDLVPQPRPRRLWSTLKPELGIGYFIALDSRISSPDVGGSQTRAAHSVRVQSLNANGEVVDLGTAPVEEDGSFYVAVPADRAVRFELFDALGKSIRREQSWIWARSGEERGCVGCHAEKAVAPENHWPQTLKRFDTPTLLSGVNHAK